MHIGELAERTGKSIHALRYYEAEGLIPHVARDTGGRRVYTERHVLWIELLIRLRATGMSMQAIKHYAALITEGDATLAQRKGMLLHHREQVEEAIREMQHCVALIDQKVAMYDAWLASGESTIKIPRVG